MIKKIHLLCFLLVSSIVSAQMINDFEQGFNSLSLNNAVYKNQNSVAFNILQCNISSTIGTVFTPPNILNNTSSKASIMTSINEPLLGGLGIVQSCVGPNGGKYALRLNNLGGGQDITSYTQTFTPTSKHVSFDYMAVLHSPHITQENVQPFFSVRLLDMNNNLLLSVPFCIKATLSDLILTNVGNNLFYTEDFYCQTIIVPEEYINTNIKIQFVIADCGAGADVGMVYLDNIRMGDPCDVNQFGFIDVSPNNEICNPEKVTINGIYQAPMGTTLVSSTVNVLDSNGNPAPVSINQNNFSNGTFSYTITFPTPLPYGGYEIEVKAIFANSLGYQYELTFLSTNPGADISFSDSSPMQIDVSVYHDPRLGNRAHLSWADVGGPYTVEFVSDGYCCPNSANGIPIDGQVYTTSTSGTDINSVFGAMVTQIESKCFRIRVRSQCNGWSDWCCYTTYFEHEGGYDLNNPNDPFNICLHEIDLNNLDPNSQFFVYPNPTTNSITITNSNSTYFGIYDYQQKLVKELKITQPKQNVEIDLSDLDSGIYVLKTENGHNIKIIKD